MSLYFQGQPRRQRPERIDDLLGNELMARIARLDVVSRKVFAGKLQGERRSKRRGRMPTMQSSPTAPATGLTRS